jgi:hypothetical protein
MNDITPLPEIAGAQLSTRRRVPNQRWSIYVSIAEETLRERGIKP